MTKSAAADAFDDLSFVASSQQSVAGLDCLSSQGDAGAAAAVADVDALPPKSKRGEALAAWRLQQVRAEAPADRLNLHGVSRKRFKHMKKANKRKEGYPGEEISSQRQGA